MSVTTTARPAIDLTEEEGAIQVPLPNVSVDDLRGKDRQVEEDLRAHLGAMDTFAAHQVFDFDALYDEATIEDCWFEHSKIGLVQENPEEEDVPVTETEVPAAAQLTIIDCVDTANTGAARRRQLTAMRHKRQRHKFEIEGLALLKEHRNERRLISRTRKRARHFKRPQRRLIGRMLNALLERLRKHHNPGFLRTVRHTDPRVPVTLPANLNREQKRDMIRDMVEHHEVQLDHAA